MLCAHFIDTYTSDYKGWLFIAESGGKGAFFVTLSRPLDDLIMSIIEPCYPGFRIYAVFEYPTKTGDVTSLESKCMQK